MKTKLFVLRIEYPITDDGNWEKIFDDNTVNAGVNGVMNYRLSGVVSDPNLVSIDLEFDNYENAETVLVGLRGWWAGIDGKMVKNRQVRMIEVLESRRISTC